MNEQDLIEGVSQGFASVMKGLDLEGLIYEAAKAAVKEWMNENVPRNAED